MAEYSNRTNARNEVGNASDSSQPTDYASITPGFVLYTVVIMIGPLCGLFLDSEAVQIGNKQGTDDSRSGMVLIANRISSLAVCATSVTAILLGLMRRPSSGCQASRQMWILCLSLIAYCAVASARCLVVDPVSTLVKPRYWITPLVVTGILLSPPTYGQMYRVFQYYIRGIALLNILFFIVDPRRIVISDYVGVLSFTDWRLFGYFCHANQFAYLLGLYILLPRPKDLNTTPFWTFAGAFVDLICISQFALTQSKTMYGLLALGLCLKAVLPWISASGPAVRSASTGAILMLLTLCSVLPIGDIFGKVAETLDIRMERAYDLTGRKEAWETLFHEWRLNPVWGHGAITWHKSGLVIFGWNWAHAHNQALQTLWESGIVGLSFLIVHCALMINCSWSTIPSYRAGIVAATCVFLLRGSTALSINVFGLDTVEYVVYLTLILAYACTRPADDDEELHASVEPSSRRLLPGRSGESDAAKRTGRSVECESSTPLIC